VNQRSLSVAGRRDPLVRIAATTPRTLRRPLQIETLPCCKTERQHAVGIAPSVRGPIIPPSECPRNALSPCCQFAAQVLHILDEVIEVYGGFGDGESPCPRRS